uniref:FBD domain-containing protein n=1 Tax=Brugia timori TaxID=42155 RepID=A0A0R3QPG8_9BILA
LMLRDNKGSQLLVVDVFVVPEDSSCRIKAIFCLVRHLEIYANCSRREVNLLTEHSHRPLQIVKSLKVSWNAGEENDNVDNSGIMMQLFYFIFKLTHTYTSASLLPLQHNSWPLSTIRQQLTMEHMCFFGRSARVLTW